MAFVIILLIAIAILAYLPQLWVKRVIGKYSVDRPDFPGTGGELARHLLDEMKLHDVRVEATDLGDHYDPEDKVVRLSNQNFGGRSLSAVVIAAHEVGHAMQDATSYAPLKVRTRMAKTALAIQRVGGVVMIAAPILMLVTRSPAAMLVDYAFGVLILASAVLMHVVTLPVEFDASFSRALPVLRAGGYIPERDMPAARRILKAAAYTYVAAALMTLLDITRWFRILRF